MSYKRTLQDDVNEMMVDHDIDEILTAMRNNAEDQYCKAVEYENVHYMDGKSRPERAAAWAMRIMILDQALADYRRSMK